MATYISRRDYFEQLANQNKLVNHIGDVPDGKAFYSGNIEEFISGTTNMLPLNNIFVYFINYQRDINWTDGAMKEHDAYKIMFFVLKQANMNDSDAQVTAFNNTELVVDQFLSRMKYDSKNNLTDIFKGGFNWINNVRVMPHKIHGNNCYVGWQVSILTTQPFQKCYNSNDWNL